VSEPAQDDLHAIWRQLARRNDWELVGDEEAFLRSVVAELGEIPEGTPSDKRARIVLLRAYGVLIYNGLRDRQERAAYELWMACYRLALREQWPPPQAELLAQETVARVLEKLHTLRSPASIISWSLKIYRTVRTSFTKHEAAEEPLQTGDEQATEPADLSDMAAEVEQRLVNQQLLDLLRDRLPNSLERLVLLRVVALGDHPRDVARDLGLPLHRTRIAKSRALQRLRDDQQLLHLLGELAGDARQRAVNRGVQDDDTTDT
jgi:DNA-directed RNA polymerase specialized sigma24 family protein